MPLSLAELASERRTFTVDTQYGPVRVTYRPYEMTPARESAIARISDDAREEAEEEDSVEAQTEAGLTRITENFLVVVDAWDLIGPLTDRDSGKELIPAGEVIPINRETLRHIPSYFLIRVLNGISEDVRPKQRRRTS